MTRSSAWIAGVVVVISAFMCAVVAQTAATDTSQAQGILPSGLGDAVDRDVAKVRDATARFKTTEAAEAAGVRTIGSPGTSDSGDGLDRSIRFIAVN